MKNKSLIKKLLALFVVLITSINAASAYTYTPSGVAQQTMQSQQVMQTGGAYNGAVYEPFGNTTPSEASNPARISGPRRAGEDNGFDPSEFDTPGDAGTQSTDSPIGEPLVMLLFALAFAGVIAIRKYRINLTKSTNMKITTSKFIAALAVLFTFGVGDLRAEAGYYEEGGKAIQLCFWKDGAESWQDEGGSQANVNNIGTVNNHLYLKKFYVYLWNSGTSVNYANLYYRIYKEGDTPGSWSHYDEDWIADMGGNNKKFGCDGDMKINCYGSGIIPGASYILEYYVDAHNIGKRDNGGNNYKIKFTVAQRYLAADFTPSTWQTSTYPLDNGKITVTGVSATTCKFKLTKYNSWDDAFGWSEASGTTGCGNKTLKDGESDNNIKITKTSSETNVVITYNGLQLCASAYQAYTVSVAAGLHGAVSTSSVSNVDASATPSEEITATPDAGYYFTGWSLPSGVTPADGYTSSSNPIRIHASAGSKTITANFAQRYVLRGSKNGDDSNLGGMAGWGATDNSSYTSFSIAGNVMTITATLTLAKTKYKFMILDRSDGSYKGQQNTGNIPSGTPWTLDGTKDVFLQSTAPGVYTFAYNFSTNSLTVTFPSTWTVTYGSGTGGSITSVTNGGYSIGSSPGYAVRGTDVTFNKSTSTGYTFKGWYTASTGGTAVSNMGVDDNVLDNISANANVYAQFTPNTYKITFDATTNGGTITNNGSTYAEGGARKIDATYDATVAGTMPTATKNGYYFKGWYTASSGGSCVINASGVWQNVDGYTNSSKQWKRAIATTLYAQYGAPVISISFSPGNVLPVDTVTVTPSFDHDPEGASSLCFVLVTASGQEMQVQPTWVDGTGYAMKFEAPSAPGNYSVDVRLFNENNHDCSDKTTGLVSSYLSRATTFTVEEAYAVTVQYKCGNIELRPSTTVYATAYQTAANVTAPDIEGLSFSSWDTSDPNVWRMGGTASDKTIQIHADGDATVIANYDQTGYVYFKNTLGWEHVYFYKYNNNDYWDEDGPTDYGTGAHKASGWANRCTDGPLEMTLVEGTDDLYAVKPASGVPSSGQSFVFTNSPSTEDFFGKTTGTSIEVVRVTTNYDATNHMIVPNKTGRTYQFYSNRAKYYRDYFEAPTLMDWEWTLRGEWGWDTPSEYGHFTSTKMGSLTFQATHYFENAGLTQEFLVYDKFGAARGKSSAVIDGTTTTPTEIATGSNLNIKLKTTYRGEYIFNLTFGHGINQVGSFSNKILVSVTYPVKQGDYRLFYTTKKHPGDVISKRANGKDTVSMYVDNADNLKIQTCASVASTSVTWNSPAVISYADGVNFATILSEGGAGVYNFVVEQDANGANPKVIAIEKYKGDYYVRTDCTNSYHKNYKDVKDDCQMTYSEYSMSSALAANKQYSHYYVKDLHGSGGSPIDIRFTVATDYSEAITDTVVAGITTPTSDPHYDFYGSASLNRVANVRFSYNEATNEIWRAYTEGPTNNNYMVLRTDGAKVYASSSAVSPTSTYKFADMGNWVYQVDVYANAPTYVKLTAEMHNNAGTANTQYLKGISDNGTDGTAYTSDDGVILLGGTAVKQHMRIVYDFKTDRMVTSWIPNGAVSGDVGINADVMLIRNGQDDTQQITFAAGDANKLTSVKTVYGVMEIDSSYVNNVVLSRYARSLYWISFPFDVNVRDIFGFGTYGKHWILEYYDGMGRAKYGWWADSEPNWKYITPSMKDTFVLKANTGYVLALSLNRMADGCTDVWVKDVNTVYLYFPSATELGTIQNVASMTMPLSQTGYKCEIDRTGNNGADINKNRKIADSYWHCIGVPSFAQNSLSGTATSSTWASNIPFVYEWSPITNRLYVNTSGSFTFEPMHAYLVQYDGTSITWTNVSNKPSIVSRRKVEGAEADFYEWNLNLMQGAEELDHTYVRMTADENATDGFDFGQDLTKEISTGANIYTFSTYVPVAGNCIPMDLNTTKTVQVGVKIATDGDYTFALPEGTDGVGVGLIDNIAGTRANLALENYTVNLAAGQYDGRFFLEISPIVQSPTGIEQTGSDRKDSVRKVMVDGILYIVKDGRIYDATGNRVQ